MSEESQVADYFVVAGLPDDPKPMDDYTDGTHLKQNHNLAPITDITVIFPSFGEVCPEGWQVLDFTPTGLLADLNFGSIHSPEVYICYKRGRHKPPLVDIGVLYENKERILPDSEIVLKTPYNRVANVNNANTKTFLTYRRAKKDMPANELVVTNICVIITSKGEKPPHAFCVIKKNLNKGVFAQDVFLCYKKSMNRANLISYKPGILCRYPTWDRPDWKLHSNVPLFCLPMGATLEVWPPEASQPDPVFSTFVLTVSDAAEKVYGSAVTFYERYPIEKLTEEQLAVLEKSLESERASNSELSLASSDKSLDSNEASPNENLSEENSSNSRRSIISGSHTFNVNKCICLLSHWPFFDTFEKFLSFLYKLSTTGPHSVPIERYISHFLENVPFPSPQRPRILVQLSAKEKVVLFQPEDIPLPRSGAGFRELLLNLGSEDTLLVLLLVLTEHKILVHSLRSNVLTSVVEALSMIMFPFKWQCPYIPLCPLGLAEVLHAPVPFLIGVDSRFFDMYDPPSDVTCIDLDTNNITVSEDRRNLTYKLLPKKAARNLKNSLEDLCKKCILSDHVMQNSRLDDEYDDDMLKFQMKDKEQKMELEIQEAFLRFMAVILKGYRSYLLPIVRAPTVGTTDPNSLFDLQGFLKSRDRAHHKFFVMLMKTQMFIRFIEERSFVSDMDVGLAFFDECTEKVDSEDSNCRLLELEESHKSERTVFIPPPEPSGLPLGVTYDYQGFNLDNSLFKSKDTKNTLQVPNQENAPGSPMARRTKHEVKSAQKLARRKHSQSAQSWAKCLLTTCYSLWFIHLPSFVINDSSKASNCLRLAYDLLVKIQKLKLHPTDEVCYRVMMQLFGVHSQPVLAINLLSQMKMCGIQPNALTYGYYNRAVLEANWPSDQSHPSQLWSKLRNVIVGAALFRRGGHRARHRLPEAESCTSIASLEKGDMVSEFEKFVKKKSSKLGSIMKPSQQNLQELVTCQTLENSAGILMTGLKKSPPLTRRKSCSDFSPRLQQTNSSVPSEVNASLLRRGSMSPTAPENDTLKLLMRCDSFAHDTSILEKHNRTNKIAENIQNSGVSKTLSVPRESSESLDITDDLSLDDSWSSQKNSDRFESVKSGSKTDTPARNLMSKLNCLSSEAWDRDEWAASQDSIESVPLSDCKDEEAEPKIKEYNFTKPPWKSSEGLLTSGELCRTPAKDVRSQRSASENRESKRKGKKSKHLYSDDNLNTTPCNSLVSSADDILHLNSASSQPENLSCNEEKSAGNSQNLNLINGGFNINKCNDISPSSKTSPIRTPVTENDPLGALQCKDAVNGTDEVVNAKATEQIGDHESSSRMKYDLSIGGLFSHHPSRNTRKDGEGNTKTRRKEGDKFAQGDSAAVCVSRVPKSATFHNGREKEIKVKTVPRGSTPPAQEISCTRKSMQRSTTLPDAAAAATAAVSSSPSVASSLSHFSSNFKFSFRKNALRHAQHLEGGDWDMWDSALRAIPTKKPGEPPGFFMRVPGKSTRVENTSRDGSRNLRYPKVVKILFSDSSGRYSPSRFSLKKSDLRIAKSQILENAISGSKKSNELLLSGFNTVKSAATSVAKKIEEVISTNSTPVKSHNASHEYEEEEGDYGIERNATLDFESWGTNLKEFFGDGSRKGSSATLQPPCFEEQPVSEEVIVENLYGKNASLRNIDNPSAMVIVMTTCCKCNNCCSVLHDEEIIAGWTPDDSNLNTKCHFCGKSTLPFLSVTAYDYRGRDRKAVSSTEISNLSHTLLNRQLNNSNQSVDSVSESKGSGEDICTNAGNQPKDSIDKGKMELSNVEDKKYGSDEESKINDSIKEKMSEKVNDHFEPYVLEPINVPYLNPLVLRKELENILNHEGDPSLTKPSFVDQHPIVYWNIIWVFERINVTSHLPGLALQSAAMKKNQFIHPSWSSDSDSGNVSVKCLWDNPRLYEEIGQPMYVLWQQQDHHSSLVSALVTDRLSMPRSVMQNIISNLRRDSLYDSMRLLINERTKIRHSHSLYRDILFLAIVACDRANIILDSFDREYTQSYERLKAEDVCLLDCDKPPVSASYRNYFRPLLLSHQLN